MNRKRFHEWVRSFGFTKLAKYLGTERGTVHSWFNQKLDINPKPKIVAEIILLSAGCLCGHSALVHEGDGKCHGRDHRGLPCNCRELNQPEQPLTFDDVYGDLVAAKGENRG